jgi:hypothetical protein
MSTPTTSTLGHDRDDPRHGSGAAPHVKNPSYVELGRYFRSLDIRKPHLPEALLIGTNLSVSNSACDGTRCLTDGTGSQMR